MNINQAKVVAGIPPSIRVSTQAGLEAALQRCKGAIVKARKDDNDALAAKLGEAFAVFKRRKKRNQNRCEICGDTIGARARRCRMHQSGVTIRALTSGANQAQPLPPSFSAAGLKSKPPLKQRKLPTSLDAQYGYWSTTVQKVVRRWRDKLGEDTCKGYLWQCHYALSPGHPVHVETSRDYHKGYVLELMVALNKLFTAKNNPDRWLLELASMGEWVNGKPVLRSYQRIRDVIKRDGGPKFTPGSLATRAKRLRLNAETAP